MEHSPANPRIKPRTFELNAFGLEIKNTKNRSEMPSKVIPTPIKACTLVIQSRLL